MCSHNSWHAVEYGEIGKVRDGNKLETYACECHNELCLHHLYGRNATIKFSARPTNCNIVAGTLKDCLQPKTPKPPRT